ncbi:hypothetical protein H0H93_000589 [Arthromyces matolae]|nr:hypothetical protein H0H93_000589 [Arthromyces matolae]
MAVISFARPGDALLAKAKYDGKVVDGRRPLKIEFISEAAQSSSGTPEGPPQAPTLLDRIGNVGKSQSTAVNGVSRPIQPFQPPIRRPAQMHAPPYPSIAVPPRHVRQKKGPRRIKKLRVPVSAAQLDKEMEDYRAGADMTGL